MLPNRLGRVRQMVQHRLLDDLGISVWRSRPEWELRPLDPTIRQLSLDAAGAIWDGWLREETRPASLQQPIAELLTEFDRRILEAPFRQTRGGNEYSGLLNLFLVGRLMQPDVIVESGVFKGLSTWVLRQACPTADLHCFDVSFRVLRYVDKQANYVERDWKGYDLGLDRSQLTLAVFDDHVDQALRVRQAAKQGIEVAFFDDDLGLEQLAVDGAPAAPTMAMIHDERAFTLDTPSAELQTIRGRVKMPGVDQVAAATRDLIASYDKLPDLSEAFGYRRSSQSVVTMRATAV